jgi:8-amino-3,8-dideoxy-alpha-D-manno-octulosonate transaminase
MKDEKLVVESKINGKLALDGGKPVRTKPMPPEFPGIPYYGDVELEYVTRVIKARNPFRFYGPDLQHMCDRFEEAFAQHRGVKYALGVSSGTEALYISLAALGVGPGDEVLLQGYLWTSCINAIVRLGAIPRMVDIDDTFTMSPEDLERKIGPRSKVVLIVHMSGAAGNIEPVLEIAQKHNLKVLEDCAQANGAKLHGKPIGTFGDIAIFSLQINKNITAGEGGVIITSDDHLYKRAFAAHDLGYMRTNKGHLLETCDDVRYQFWGAGARMSELTGALALAQLGKIDKITDAMRTAKWKIRRQLEDIPGLKLRKVLDPEGDSGSFMISIHSTPEISQKFVQALRAEGIKGEGDINSCLSMEEWGLHWFFNNLSLVNKRSISASGWPWTLAENAFARDYSYERKTLPNCDDFASRSVLLMIPSCLTDEDIADIVTAYKKVAKHLL